MHNPSVDAFDGAFSPQALGIVMAILVKCGIGVILAGAIGWERELHGRPAGVRTHMLMALGVILFTEMSKAFGGGDPSRIAAQVVTGVGFLGAGTIMRMGPEIKGLTTAASLWASAGIGMTVAVGGPYIWVAVIGTLLALATLTLVDNIERKFNPRGQTHDLLLRIEGKQSVGPLLKALEEAGAKVSRINFSEEGRVHEVVVRCAGDKQAVIQAASACEGVGRASWVD